MDNFKRGYVLNYKKSDKFGFIQDQEGLKYFFVVANIIHEPNLKVGDEVSFMPFEAANGLNAKFISKKTEDNSKPKNDLPKKILSEWKLEGSSENNSKLFYFSSEIQEIVDGDKCFVIGRKGMGKTAIAEYLLELDNFETHTEALNFKSFPINELYEKGDNKFSLQNRYITIWKYIIYGSVLKMMSKNEKINPNLTSKLRKIFPMNSLDTLERKIDKLSEVSLSFSFMGNGFGGGYKTDDSSKETTESILEKSQQFENIIIDYIDSNNYYIIIDALDDDYSDFHKRKEYFYLLNGLHKAVREIKSIFSKRSINLFPVVFLRDDIYRQIDDSDKVKWRDETSRIYWDKKKMQKMLAHRICKTIAPEGIVYSFDLAISKLFSFDELEFEKRKTTVFRIILERSYMRPRDFIVFIKLCCERAIKKETVIDERIVHHSIDAFSSYLIEDIEYEIKPILPEISEVITVLMHLRKSVFTFDEFDSELKSARLKGIFNSDKKSVTILNVLYDFNVIGNVTKKGREIFSMYNSNQKSTLNFNEKIKIKHGLEIALGI